MQGMLRLGSTGPAVEELQHALNIAGQSVQAKLDPDGLFGPRTYARVREFQGHKGLAADGIVGPNTFAALEQYFKLLKDHLEKMQPPETELAARQKVVQTAEQMFQAHGWRDIDKVGVSHARIAANKCADPATRMRQGGVVLSTIWSVAGVGSPTPPSCLTISAQAEKNYANGVPGRNMWDLPSWCGIFALSVYKLAGLRLSSWPLKHKGLTHDPELEAVTRASDVRPGDLGIFDFRPNHTNHHFIVVGVSGGTVTSIEGNVTQPTGIGAQTIVKRQKFGVHQIMADPFSAFARPIWSKVL